jgi:hypothetical protein
VVDAVDPVVVDAVDPVVVDAVDPVVVDAVDPVVVDAIPHVISAKQLALDTLESLADTSYKALSGKQKHNVNTVVTAFIQDELSAPEKAAIITALISKGFINHDLLDTIYGILANAELRQAA